MTLHLAASPEHFGVEIILVFHVWGIQRKGPAFPTKRMPFQLRVGCWISQAGSRRASARGLMRFRAWPPMMPPVVSAVTHQEQKCAVSPGRGWFWLMGPDKDTAVSFLLLSIFSLVLNKRCSKDTISLKFDILEKILPWWEDGYQFCLSAASKYTEIRRSDAALVGWVGYV